MKRVFFLNNKENIKLEGRIWEPKTSSELTQKYYAVISHPHPQYGGSQDNNVVFAARRAMIELKIPSITFNLRGVGESEGSFDNGRGEVHDLLSVISASSQEKFQDRNLILIGYSFGSIITLESIKFVTGMKKHALFASSDFNINHLEKVTLISYPFGFMPQIKPDFNNDTELIFIHGDRDDLADFSRMNEEIGKFKGKTSKKVIKNADHFYFGFEEQLKRVILEIYGSLL